MLLIWRIKPDIDVVIPPDEVQVSQFYGNEQKTSVSILYLVSVLIHWIWWKLFKPIQKIECKMSTVLQEPEVNGAMVDMYHVSYFN